MNSYRTHESLKELISSNRSFIMGCAMIAIMLFHQQFFTDNLLIRGFHLFGYWGVDVFLLISGLGIISSLQRNSTKQYFKNRANRLVPTCLFVGLSKYLLMQAGFINFAAYNDNAALIITELSMWYIYAIVVYYILAPLIYRLLQRYKFRVVVGACLLSFLLSYIPFESSSYYLVSRASMVVERLPVFVLGMYLGLYPTSKLSPRAIIGYGLIPLIVAVATRLTAFPGYERALYLALTFAAPALCLIAATARRWVHTIRLDGVVGYFGRLSLQFYLWHGFVFLNINEHSMFAEFDVWTKFMIAMAITVIFSHATHSIIGLLSPIIKLK